jgi:hypothetical protein
MIVSVELPSDITIISFLLGVVRVLVFNLTVSSRGAAYHMSQEWDI